MPHILIATDLSDSAMHAAEYAVTQFGHQGNTYILLHTYMDMTTADPMVPAMTRELMVVAEDGLKSFARRFEERTGATAVRREVRFGPLASVVSDMARSERIRLIVIGNTGRTGLAIFGSNAVSVIKMNRIPVLAVPFNARLDAVKRILLADDHEDVLPRHLETLRLIATLNRSEIIVAHVDADLPGDTVTWTDRMYGIALRGIPHRFEVIRDQDVANGLGRLARSLHVDMVAVLHRHIGLFNRLFHPSTTKELVHQAELPLLVLQDAD